MAYYVPPSEKVRVTRSLCPPPNCAHAFYTDTSRSLEIFLITFRQKWSGLGCFNIASKLTNEVTRLSEIFTWVADVRR